MILLAFDVDGTLDTSAGPVPWAKVVEFLNMHPDVAVGIVSPSAARPKIGINTQEKDGGPARKVELHHYQSSPETRAGNLQLFRQSYPGAALRFYVSDNNDTEAAVAAGFSFLTPQEFLRGFLA
jgi:hypothetical protein